MGTIYRPGGLWLKMKPELLYQEQYLSIERIPVPGGFLYITRYWYNGTIDTVSVATTFVPTPSGGP